MKVQAHHVHLSILAIATLVGIIGILALVTSSNAAPAIIPEGHYKYVGYDPVARTVVFQDWTGVVYSSVLNPDGDGDIALGDGVYGLKLAEPPAGAVQIDFDEDGRNDRKIRPGSLFVNR